MKVGLVCGINKASTLQRRSRGPLNLFLQETGGYTSLAVVTSLLVSLSLLFGMVGASWYVAKANKTQAIADSAALAGQNVIAGYATVAQVLDACVLSM